MDHVDSGRRKKGAVMANDSGFVITKETWENMDEEQRSWILFDTMQRNTAEVRRLRKWNKTTGLAGGVLGGIAATLGLKWGT